MNYLLSTQRLGWAWLEILAMVECQQKEPNPGRKLECLEYDLPARKAIRDQGKDVLTEEENILIPFLAKLTRDQINCECQPGTFQQEKKTQTGSFPEFRCVKCPWGSYTKVPAAKECVKCPEIPDPRIEIHRPCIEQRLKEIEDELTAKEGVISGQTAQITQMTKAYEVWMSVYLVMVRVGGGLA